MILSEIPKRLLASSMAVAIALSALTLLAVPGAAEPYENTSTLPDLPVNRALAATAVVDGKLYVIGGALVVNPDIGSCVNTVLIYDIGTGEVTNGAPMPIGVAAAAYGLGPDGNIYVVGGWTGATYTQSVQVYDPVDDSWTTNVISLPDWIGRSTSAFGLDGKLYVFGGGWSPNVTLIYSPDTDSWLYGADVPLSECYDATAVAISDTEIMLMGGNPGPTDQAWIYNTEDDEYTEVASMNYAKRGAGGAFARNGYVYSFGGTSSTSIYGSPQLWQIERYDIAEDTWTVSDNGLPWQVSNFATAVDSYGRILLVGGQNGASVVDYVQMLLPMEVSGVDLVEITSPADGSFVNGVVPVVASMANSYTWSFMAVDLYVDGNLAETKYSSSTEVTFLWDTSVLADRSSHVLMVRAFAWDGNVFEDSISVTVLAKSIEDTISDLMAQIDALEAALDSSNASQSAQIAELTATLVALQGQLALLGGGMADMSDRVDTLEDKADSANLWGMITMILVIIVIVLLALMFVMGRKKAA